jgi:hypothetical protein
MNKFLSIILISALPNLAWAGTEYKFHVESGSFIKEKCVNDSEKSRVGVEIVKEGSSVSNLQIRAKVCLSKSNLKKVNINLNVPSELLDASTMGKMKSGASKKFSGIPSTINIGKNVSITVARKDFVDIKVEGKKMQVTPYVLSWSPEDYKPITIYMADEDSFSDVTNFKSTHLPWRRIKIKAQVTLEGNLYTVENE